MSGTVQGRPAVAAGPPVGALAGILLALATLLGLAAAAPAAGHAAEAAARAAGALARGATAATQAAPARSAHTPRSGSRSDQQLVAGQGTLAVPAPPLAPPQLAAGLPGGWTLPPVLALLVLVVAAGTAVRFRAGAVRIPRGPPAVALATARRPHPHPA